MPEAFAKRIERYLLIALAGLAIAAFGASYDQVLAWALWLACALAAFWQMPSAPAWLRNSARNVAYVVLGVTVVLGVIFMAFPVLLPAPTAARLTLATGYSLAILAALFLLGQQIWRPAATLLPAAFGLFAVACFNPFARVRLLIVLGALAVVGSVALEILAAGRVSWSRAILRFGGAIAIAGMIGGGIALLLPLAQSGVENLTFLVFLRGETPLSGFSDVSRLGDIESLKLSTRPVLRLWTTSPRHLRGRVFAKFDGQTWVAGRVKREPLSVKDSASLGPQITQWAADIPGTLYAPNDFSADDATGQNLIRTRVVQIGANPGLLLAPGQTRLVQAPVDSVSADAARILTVPAGVNASVYGVVHRRSGELVQPGTALPEQLAESLALPADTDARLKELAGRLSEGQPSAAERIRRTVNYVESECRYSLEPGKSRSKQVVVEMLAPGKFRPKPPQPVAEFLFETKKGYCQYFASATAVLLRLQGVPARYVHGFNVNEGNRIGDHYLVRELDAHAWVEAYLPEQGWVEVDPTPAAEYEALHAGLRGGWFENAKEWMSAKVSEFWAHARLTYGLGAFRWLWMQAKGLMRSTPRFLVLFFFVGGILLALRVWKRWKRTRAKTQVHEATPSRFPEKAPELAVLVGRLDEILVRSGCPRPPAHPPFEHWTTLPDSKIAAELRAIGFEIIDAYYRASFGGVPPAASEVATLKERFATTLRRAS